MTKEEMDAYCATCKDKGFFAICRRNEICDICKIRQPSCVENCVREHRDGVKFRGGRGYNG